MSTEQAAIYAAGAGVTEQQQHLNYAPLPWQTHPIDQAFGSQGWGPMDGPYSPLDFVSAKDSQSGGSGIDITWLKGDNSTSFAPTYATLSLLSDKSIDLVANHGFMGTLMQESGQPQLNSTISQASTVQTSGVAPTPQGASGFWQSLKQLISNGGPLGSN